MHSSHIQCVFFIIFFTKQTMPLNQFLLLRIAFTLPWVNFAAHIYKPEIWGVGKQCHGWQLTPGLQHLTQKTGEGQKTPYNTIISRVYSHPCFLLSKCCACLHLFNSAGHAPTQPSASLCHFRQAHSRSIFGLRVHCGKCVHDMYPHMLKNT